MEDVKNQSRDLLHAISANEIPPDLSEKATQDALSIVIDAINSTVGGVIITSLNGTIRFANPSFWNQIEIYIKNHSEADFSHSICPECAEELYPELYKKL